MTEHQKKRREMFVQKWGDAHQYAVGCGYDAATKEAQVLVEALEKTANHKQNSVDKLYLIHQCEGYQNVAREALAAWRGELGQINVPIPTIGTSDANLE